jgi:hypothetical protein
MSLSAILMIIAAAVAAAALGNGLYEAVFGLRAKARARRLLARQAATNGVLRELAARNSERPLDETELRQAARVIEQSLDGLSDGDRRRVEQGLHQPSRSGEQRFIEELIGSG